GVRTYIVILDLITEGNKEKLINNTAERNQVKNIMNERPRTLHVTPEHFTGSTTSNFLDNVYYIKDNWTWKEMEEAFIEQYLPIGYITLIKTILENKRQGESETATNFITEIKSLCRQIDNKMKEEDICTFVLKLKRISNRGTTASEYTNMFNLQVIKLQKYHDEKEREEKKKLQEENEEYKRIIDQINEEVKRLNIVGKQSNKTVEFEGRHDDE
ncbi:serine/threonine-protein kinase fray2-like, partial [Aphis craccivora]